ncbi:MAG TPA: circadian clock protein KaiC [Nakamurella sp.]
MSDATGAGSAAAQNSGAAGLVKAPTGIGGFDEITRGGLPHGRATLVTGGAGSGKTLFGLEFLFWGARKFGEPGVLLSFEESAEELATNVSSLGFDLPQLQREGLLAVDAFRIDRDALVAAGGFDLEGLFIRLGRAVDSIGAKRVVLDTIEVLFTALGSESTVRAEVSRLLRWLKDRGLTVIITGEPGRSGELTRYGIEEYVSDCVVVLDDRVQDELATRRLRVAKYRGSLHGTNEYPFVITDRGIVVLPLIETGLAYQASNERISTGIDRLDHMLDGGVYRGSTVLVSGGSGTGKTSLAGHMVDAACRRGERALYVSYEESQDQVLRNMGSIGLDLNRWVESGLLRLWAVRPAAYGLEEHLVQLQRRLDEFGPSLVVLDAMAGLNHIGTSTSVSATIASQIDMIKSRGVTAVLTALTHYGQDESSVMAVSSLMDTWLLLRNTELDGERNRLLLVIKSRGSAHSNQVREFVLTARGAELLVYVGPRGVLTGSARMAQRADERAAATGRNAQFQRRRQALARRTAQVEQQITALRDELAAELAELDQFIDQDVAAVEGRDADRAVMAAHRWADPSATKDPEANQP